MANVHIPKEVTKKDIDSMQQPLAKDGYSNDRFDELYGSKTKNPFHNTERDRRGKRTTIGYSEEYEQGWERIFGKKQ
jgi:peptidoglycan hydrolase-like protein with peptidoglycan-binding domain